MQLCCFSSMMGQSSTAVGKLDSSSAVSSRHSKIQQPYGNENLQHKPTQHTGFSQQSSHKQTFSAHQYSQQSRPLPPAEAPGSKPSAHAAQQSNKSWRFTNSFQQQKSDFTVKKSTNQPPKAQPTKNQVESYIITCVMRKCQKLDQSFLVICYSALQ